MKTYGRGCVSDLLGDAVVYRNLRPLERDLPSLDDLRSEVGVAEGVVPRKSTPEYAAVVARILKAARPEVQRVLFVGDTRLNDGRAFTNICQAGGWPGLAFIAAERRQQPPAHEVERLSEEVYLFAANRWAALADFDIWRATQNFPVDAQTAVLIDLDKTTLGARGRNDHVIDRVRVEAAFQTAERLLGATFDPVSFRRAYDVLNQVEFHPFTTDNQDYLVYLCLILGGGVFSLDELVADVRAGVLSSFDVFLARVDVQLSRFSSALQQMHREVAERTRAGDPTPFKAFRRNEYRSTAARMGQLSPTAPPEEMLAEEIVLTREVLEQAEKWQAAGAFLFGLSDKPDEASIPPAEEAARGAQPIHRMETDILGE